MAPEFPTLRKLQNQIQKQIADVLSDRTGLINEHVTEPGQLETAERAHPLSGESSMFESCASTFKSSPVVIDKTSSIYRNNSPASISTLLNNRDKIGIANFRYSFHLIRKKNNYKAFKILSFINEELLFDDLDSGVDMDSTANTQRFLEAPIDIDNDKLSENNLRLSLFQNFQIYLNNSNNSNNNNNFNDYKMAIPSRLLSKFDTIKNCFSIQELINQKKQLKDNFKMVTFEKSLMTNDQLREINDDMDILMNKRNTVIKNINSLNEDKEYITETIQAINERIEFLIEYNLAKQGKDDEEDDNISESFERNIVREELYSDDNEENSKDAINVRRFYKSGTQLGSIRNGHSSSISCLDFNLPFGKLYSASQLNNDIKIFNLKDHEIKEINTIKNAHLTTINCMELNTENNILITGGKDAIVKIWDVNENNLEFNDKFESHSDEITTLNINDTNLITGSQDKTIKQWDLTKGKNIQTLRVGFILASNNNSSNSEQQIGSGYYDKNFLVKRKPIIGALESVESALATGTSDGIIRLWDLRGGTIIRELKGHKDLITSIKFDKFNIISSSLDGSIRIWDIRMNLVNDILNFEKSINSIELDDKNIIVNTFDDKIRVYDREENIRWEVEREEEEKEKIEVGLVDKYPTSIETFKYKNGYLIEGESDGSIHSWAI